MEARIAERQADPKSLFNDSPFKPVDKDANKEALREKVIEDSFSYGIQPRFGLFSNPVSTAIGDNGAYRPVPKKVDADGQVKTEPRNFYTTKMKTGRTDQQQFMPPTYISVGDPFIMAGKMAMRSFSKDGHLKAGHEKAFKPAKIVQEMPKALFEYMPLGIKAKTKKLDQDGSVPVGPRNIMTSPIKEGKVGPATTLGGQIPYVEDDYNHPRVIAKKEREYHLSKLQEKPFSQVAKRTAMFNSYSAVYEENPPIPAKAGKDSKSPTSIHEKPFKPANPPKVGNHCTFEPFPEHKPNPPKEITRKKEDEEGLKPFKRTYRSLARPQPSIATNMRNLKSSFPSVFGSMSSAF